MSCGYVAIVFAGATVITGLAGDWWPQEPVLACVLLAGAVLVVAALSLLASVVFAATANGIAVLMAFGAGLTAGLLGQIGDGIGSRTLTRIADVGSWVLPFEALYRAALAALVPDVGGVAGAVIELGLLGGSHPGGTLLIPFVVAYLAAVARARDLALQPSRRLGGGATAPGSARPGAASTRRRPSARRRRRAAS